MIKSIFNHIDDGNLRKVWLNDFISVNLMYIFESFHGIFVSLLFIDFFQSVFASFAILTIFNSLAYFWLIFTSVIYKVIFVLIVLAFFPYFSTKAHLFFWFSWGNRLSLVLRKLLDWRYFFMSALRTLYTLNSIFSLAIVLFFTILFALFYLFIFWYC